MMEADSTGSENFIDDRVSESSSIDEVVQNSQVSSCEDKTVSNVLSSSTVSDDIEKLSTETLNVAIVNDTETSKEKKIDNGHMTWEKLDLKNVETEGEGMVSTNENLGETILTEKELEHIEESVLKKYTGLDIDLASENQLLKEDVIKCRCELEKYGRKLAALERKLDKANSYNNDLRVQVEKLSSEIHEYRREKHKLFVHVDTQTSSEDLMDVEDDTLYDVNLPGLKPECDMTFDWKAGLDEGQGGSGDSVIKDGVEASGMSIADSLKATAEAAMNQTGFVFDEQSGLYYDYNTGYYYNAEKGLYYDPKSGTYFYYNKSTGKYEFHSQVDLSYYTPKTIGYSDRSYSSHRHSYSDKYPMHSPDHGETSSGKKKKKKESRRRSSEEKEHKKKKRKKDKNKESSVDSDEDNEKTNSKKRRKSMENENQPTSNIIDDINKKIKDRSNIVMGELNYKKLKQSDKLMQDSKKKPKLLNENQANVSICDDVIKDEENRQGSGMGLGSKKIKLVLKKKEKEEEKTDENNDSKDTDGDGCKTTDDTTINEKRSDESSENEKEKVKNLDLDKSNTSNAIENLEKMEDMESDPKKNEAESLNQKTKMLYKKSMKNSTIQENEPVETVSKNPMPEKIDTEPAVETPAEITDQEHSNELQNVVSEQELEDKEDPSRNPFYIAGLEGDDEMLRYDNVGIVNNEEILRICSKLNSEKSPEECNLSTDAMDAEKMSTNQQLDNNMDSQKVVATYMNLNEKESDSLAENQTDNKSVDTVTNAMLGIEKHNGESSVNDSSEKIIKIIPVKSSEGGEENLYSDDDDIMIVEKDEEKIMIELNSDDSDEEKEINELQNKSDNTDKKSRWNLEPGEITDSSSYDSYTSTSSSSQDSNSQPTWVEIVRQPAPATEESTLQNAPCIRAMVSFSDLLDEGLLFIITIKGGFIGRETSSDTVICVPDINISKVHAEIRFNRKQQMYTLQDKGSMNGTFVNEERISESKHVSKWVPLKHGDTLQLSCTRFDIHIHPGTDTCDKCEPGQVVALKQAEKKVTTVTKDIKSQHREQLKKIKKKYGIVSSYNDNPSAINNPNYQDKAAERRQLIGTDNPYTRDDFPSSVNRPISEENKGHRLLKKMGWSEGESLGKDNAGIQEPINVTVRVDKAAGLGAHGKSNEICIGNIGILNARRRFVQSQLRYTHSSTGHKPVEKQSFEPKMWVPGPTQQSSDLINNDTNKNE